MIKAALKKIVQGLEIEREEMTAVMSSILLGGNEAATSDQVGAFLMGLATRKEKSSEILSVLQFVLEQQISSPIRQISNVIDLCGTGGDGGKTFNVSTCAALIAAAAGVLVAKHGNRAFSSACGSADVAEVLGIPIQLSPELAAECLRQTNFVFLFAPAYNPVLAAVSQVRRNLGIRTIFNLIGPLANPARVKRQVLGVSDSTLLLLYAEILCDLNVDHALIVQGEDGLDEVSLIASTRCVEIRKGQKSDFILNPRDLGFSLCAPHEIAGKDRYHNAQIIEAVLSGKDRSPYRSVSILNAAIALSVSPLFDEIQTPSDRLKKLIQMAEEAVDSGRALETLQKLRSFKAQHELPKHPS